MRLSKQLYLFILMSIALAAAEPHQLTLDLNGQFSLNYAQAYEGEFSNSPSTFHYIPKLRADYQANSTLRLGLDTAFDIYHFSLGDSSLNSGIDFYRLTLRYDSPNTQIRFGLQKINFGPAKMLRVLQWFDQVDPRDPLALSPGVWAAMARQYFDNGMNLRLWVMNDAPDPRRDYSSPNDPPIDMGGRIEYPVPAGTLGLTLHTMSLFNPDLVQEQRAAFDLRLDAIFGIWSEIMFSHSDKLIKKDQISAMIGLDYTIGVGNGLYIAAETYTAHFGNIDEEMPWVTRSSALMGSYTLGLSDALTAYLYIIEIPDIKSQYIPMLGWQHTSGNWLYYIAIYDMPDMAMGGTLGLPVGTGLQFNIAYNH